MRSDCNDGEKADDMGILSDSQRIIRYYNGGYDCRMIGADGKPDYEAQRLKIECLPDDGINRFVTVFDGNGNENKIVRLSKRGGDRDKGSGDYVEVVSFRE